VTRAGQKVGVLGAGTMGVGIAVVGLLAGHDVVLRDLSESDAWRGADRVREFLESSVARGKLDPQTRDETLERLVPTEKLEQLADCDVVIEAVVERVSAKQEAFAELDDVCSDRTLFHSNTSTLSVTEIASGSRNPGRVVGTHYCNPAPLMKLVEVVRARQTSDDAYARTVDFICGLGKAVVTTQDVPGFIVNRFLVPFENDCIRALESGLGTVESIDQAVTGALRYPMGPFTLLDVVGLDVHKQVSTSLFEQLHDPRFSAPPLVDRMIAEGALGRKAGRGFYEYGQPALFGTK
jgi:3-hydroxybutyryl-CoA dehydrogenase